MSYVIQRTFEHHLGGDGSRVADGRGHRRVLARVAVDDEVDVDHLLVVVRPLDADVVSHYQHIPLTGYCSKTRCHHDDDDMIMITSQPRRHTVETTGAALLENNEASAKLTTANGGTFTSNSATLSSQSRYSTLDQ